MSDKQAEQLIIKNILDGQKAEYANLITAHKNKIYMTLLGMLHHPQDAEDLAQDVFIKAFKRLSNFKGDASFYTWLHRIAINTGIDFIRKKKRNPSILVDESKGGIDGLNHKLPKQKISSDAENKEILAFIYQAMDTLSPEHRNIFYLREFEGYSYAEIAQCTQLQIGTVMSRLHHSRKKIKLFLERFEIR